MAGSWVLLHPANTRFAERVIAVRQNNWLQYQLPKDKENMNFNCVYVSAFESQVSLYHF